MPTTPRCDIFCRVIDNYGDIGVCWRLARQLVAEHGWQVRLWVDDLNSCHALVEPDAGIEIQHWGDDFNAIAPADIVIEAFACELPDTYLAAMARQARPPIWINLEYLCVEAWGAGFHAQPSPHPRLPLTKYFFVPGVLSGSGGVLHERNLQADRQHFDRGAARAQYAANSAGHWAFMFCYNNPTLPALLDAWRDGDSPVHCLVAAGLPTEQVSHWLGTPLTAGQSQQRAQLTLHPLPFVKQSEFDALLWTCDMNFIRGEDSFCRAQLAALPLIWQIYPQADAVHIDKLAEFATAYCANLPKAAAHAWQDFQDQWNAPTPPAPKALADAWQTLQHHMPALHSHAETWLKHLISLGNLAENLAIFCKNR